jgi:hypothetical protein
MGHKAHRSSPRHRPPAGPLGSADRNRGRRRMFTTAGRQVRRHRHSRGGLCHALFFLHLHLAARRAGDDNQGRKPFRPRDTADQLHDAAARRASHHCEVVGQDHDREPLRVTGWRTDTRVDSRNGGGKATRPNFVATEAERPKPAAGLYVPTALWWRCLPNFTAAKVAD